MQWGGGVFTIYWVMPNVRARTTIRRSVSVQTRRSRERTRDNFIRSDIRDPMIPIAQNLPSISDSGCPKEGRIEDVIEEIAENSPSPQDRWVENAEEFQNTIQVLIPVHNSVVHLAPNKKTEPASRQKTAHEMSMASRGAISADALTYIR